MGFYKLAWFLVALASTTVRCGDLHTSSGEERATGKQREGRVSFCRSVEAPYPLETLVAACSY